jgi:micrococcal nuclease
MHMNAGMKNSLVTLLQPFTGKKRAVQISTIILLIAGIGYTLFSQYYPTASEVSAQVTPTPTVPVASPSATPLPGHGGVFATVVSVVDGDTIKIEGGEVVRYIGVDTPETVAPNKPVQCYGKEASAKNKELVQGQVVELVRDVSQRDKFGRLLRYVWVGDVMVNEYLVREGYAHVSTYPPDVSYVDTFLAAEKSAREENKGLWSGVCPVVTPTTATVATPSSTVLPTP